MNDEFLAYHFAFTDTDGTPTRYYGLVVAPSLQELLITVDQFGDPHRALYKEVDDVSGVCFHARDLLPDASSDKPVFSQFELAEELSYVPGAIDDSWVTIEDLLPDGLTFTPQR